MNEWLIAEKYNLLVLDDGVQAFGGVKVPVIKAGMTSSWVQYIICFQDGKEREQAMRVFKENHA